MIITIDYWDFFPLCPYLSLPASYFFIINFLHSASQTLRGRGVPSNKIQLQFSNSESITTFILILAQVFCAFPCERWIESH